MAETTQAETTHGLNDPDSSFGVTSLYMESLLSRSYAIISIADFQDVVVVIGHLAKVSLRYVNFPEIMNINGCVPLASPGLSQL